MLAVIGWQKGGKMQRELAAQGGGTQDGDIVIAKELDDSAERGVRADLAGK